MHLFFKSGYSFFKSIIRVQDLENYLTVHRELTYVLVDDNLHFSYEFIKIAKKNKLNIMIGLEINIFDTNVILLSSDMNSFYSLVKISSFLYRNDKLINEKDFFTLLEQKCDLSNIYAFWLDKKNLSCLNQSWVKITSHIKKNFYYDCNFKIGCFLNNEELDIFKIHLKTGNYNQNDFKYLSTNLEEAIVKIPSIKNFAEYENFKKNNLFANHNSVQIKASFFDYCLEKLKKLVIVDQLHLNRLENECKVIEQFGLKEYFLIVADYVDFAKQQGIMVGPGRGSAVGCLVAFALGITKINPLPYGLLFERFLNPNRNSLPDIDIDFQDNRRYEVINYLINKYGTNNVCQIVTYQNIGMRTALKDVSRAMGYEPAEINLITKALPFNLQFDLKKSIENIKSLKAFYYANSKNKVLYDFAYRLINLPRQTSIHAAGIIICSEELQNILPTFINADNQLLTQWDMSYLEEFNLIKMDLLGLKNLTAIAEIITLIYKQSKQIIDINKIPLNDKKTFEILQKGQTTGIFQLESPGMTSLVVKIKPREIEDIVAANSLYRPGPQDYINQYIENKNNKLKIEYPSKDLQAILKPTNGIIIFQEQIIQIVQIYAFFTTAEADIFRRAIAKKDAKQISALKEKFISQAVAHNKNKIEAEKIFNLIEKFSDYGFNRSHAVAYSMLGYQMAYLKANYCKEFFTCLLNSVLYDQTKLKLYINEAHNNSLIFVLPTIFLSTNIFYLRNNKIVMPFSVINGLGNANILNIQKAQKEFMKYKSAELDIYKVFNILLKNEVSKNCLIKLIESGSFDVLKINRLTILENLQTIIEYSSFNKTNNLLAKILKPPKLKVVKPNFLKISHLEYQSFGFYLKFNPINSFKSKHKETKYSNLIDLKSNQTLYKVICLITMIKIKKQAKNGKDYLLIRLEDETTAEEIYVFGDLVEKIKQEIELNSLVETHILLNSFHKFKLKLENIKAINIE